MPTARGFSSITHSDGGILSARSTPNTPSSHIIPAGGETQNVPKNRERRNAMSSKESIEMAKRLKSVSIQPSGGQPSTSNRPQTRTVPRTKREGIDAVSAEKAVGEREGLMVMDIDDSRASTSHLQQSSKSPAANPPTSGQPQTHSQNARGRRKRKNAITVSKADDATRLLQSPRAKHERRPREPSTCRLPRDPQRSCPRHHDRPSQSASSTGYGTRYPTWGIRQPR